MILSNNQQLQRCKNNNTSFGKGDLAVRVARNVLEGKPLARVRSADRLPGLVERLKPLWSSESHFDACVLSTAIEGDKREGMLGLILDKTKHTAESLADKKIKPGEGIELYVGDIAEKARAHADTLNEQYGKVAEKTVERYHSKMSQLERQASQSHDQANTSFAFGLLTSGVRLIAGDPSVIISLGVKAVRTPFRHNSINKRMSEASERICSATRGGLEKLQKGLNDSLEALQKRTEKRVEHTVKHSDELQEDLINGSIAYKLKRLMMKGKLGAEEVDKLLYPDKYVKGSTKKVLLNLKEGKPASQLRPKDQLGGIKLDSLIKQHWGSEEQFDQAVAKASDKTLDDLIKLMQPSSKEGRVNLGEFQLKKFEDRIIPDVTEEDFLSYIQNNPKCQKPERLKQLSEGTEKALIQVNDELNRDSIAYKLKRQMVKGKIKPKEVYNVIKSGRSWGQYLGLV